MLTDPGDRVLDPFAGSCVTGEVCDRLDRQWLCVELLEEYLEAALGRFVRPIPEANGKATNGKKSLSNPDNYYKVPRAGLLWNGVHGDPLPADGGKTRNGKSLHSADQPKLIRETRKRYKEDTAETTLASSN